MQYILGLVTLFYVYVEFKVSLNILISAEPYFFNMQNIETAEL